MTSTCFYLLFYRVYFTVLSQFTRSILQLSQFRPTLSILQLCQSLLGLFYSCVTVYSVYFTVMSQFTRSILQLSQFTPTLSILHLCHSLLSLFYSCVTVYSVYITVVSQFTQYSHKSPVVIEVSHRTNADSIDTGENGK